MATKGTETKRERRPGVWEIRVAGGGDPVTGRTLQRSVTFHGSEADAEATELNWQPSTPLAGRWRGQRPC